MANVYYLKKSAKDCVVKVVGLGSVTIPLSDLLTDKQIVKSGDTLTANINEFYWTCDYSGKIIISRNGGAVATLRDSNFLSFGAGFVDDTFNNEDITIDIQGANSAVWIKLVKHGYTNTVEQAVFSIYDNPNVAGE